VLVMIMFIAVQAGAGPGDSSPPSHPRSSVLPHLLSSSSDQEVHNCVECASQMMKHCNIFKDRKLFLEPQVGL
jgi:hypothetical protein